MGMDLCLKLMELNRALNLNNFSLVVRLSEGSPLYSKRKPERWKKEVIRDQLMPFAGQLSKIWVCGPPMLNQIFDISLEELRAELGMERSQIEIM